MPINFYIKTIPYENAEQILELAKNLTEDRSNSALYSHIILLKPHDKSVAEIKSAIINEFKKSPKSISLIPPENLESTEIGLYMNHNRLGYFVCHISVI